MFLAYDLAEANIECDQLKEFAKANECRYGHYSAWVGAIAERDWEKARADKLQAVLDAYREKEKTDEV
mgnify:CR=1 FL=1